jgi:hypothetical protein
MKNAIKLILVAAIVAFAGTASAQNTASANGYASGNIITPISITPQSSGINFGNIVTGVAGTVTEMHGNDVDAPLTLNPGSNHGTLGNAQYVVFGQPNYVVNWSVANGSVNNNLLPSGVTLNSVTVDPVGSAPSLSVANPTATNGGGAGGANGTVTLAGGIAPLSFGGVLGLTGSEPVSGPTGFSGQNNFTVIVSYQ